MESFLHYALFISPYRCDVCYERHWRFRTEKQGQRSSTHSQKHAA